VIAQQRSGPAQVASAVAGILCAMDEMTLEEATKSIGVSVDTVRR